MAGPGLPGQCVTSHGLPGQCVTSHGLPGQCVTSHGLPGQRITSQGARGRRGMLRWLPVRGRACQQRLSQFFTQWFDTACPSGGGKNRPMITGPGLADPDFYSGMCP